MTGPGIPRVLAGYSPDERGDDALALASLVARTAGAPLTVANVHPPPWPARGPGSVDAEWVAYLREQSRDALRQAGERLAEAGAPAADLTVHTHRGSGRGLLEVAGRAGAGLIVIGSAPRGRRGRIALGSTADQLLHASPVPVLLAPRGYAGDVPERLRRLTVAYRRRRDVEPALAAAARLAGALGMRMRLVTLALRPSGLPARFRGGADDIVARQVAAAERDLDRAAGRLAAAGVEAETEVAQGAGVAKALGMVETPPGEILACLSSPDGPLRTVFLGEGAGKIVRNAPCPVLVLPRASARDRKAAG